MSALHCPWRPGNKAAALSFGLCSATAVFPTRFLAGITIIFLLSFPYPPCSQSNFTHTPSVQKDRQKPFSLQAWKSWYGRACLFFFQFPYLPQSFCPVHTDFFCLIEGLFIDNGRLVIISKILLIPKHFASAPVVQL